ncbi:MAG: ZIP family metal transporter [Candidatus Thalassarchaeaceae archaeon]|jgi:zinc transporter ZupT|nr:ZIP family metal transporter [Candidatus Thalassarchaeaceae archaeon]
MEPPLLYVGLTLVFGLVGGLVPILTQSKEDTTKLKMLTGIASGIIIASAMLVVIPEGFELASEEHEEEAGHEEHEEEVLGHLAIGGALLAGFALMLILEGSGIGHAVHEEHHDHEHDHGHGHVHHGPSGWMLVFGLSLHAATDGLAIGAAAASGGVTVTAAVALAVLIHKAPAAFSLGVFSMHERDDKNKSIRDVIIFSLATPVMILVAFYALADLEHHMIGLAMLFSAGTFLYVATVDTLPDIHSPETGRKALMYVLTGIVIIVALLVLADSLHLGHEH